MKIRMIELKELEVYEEEGEHKTRYINSKKVPAALTNHALMVGRNMGLLEGSLISDFAKLFGVNQQDIDEIQKNPERVAEYAHLLGGVDEIQCLKIIYLGCVGLNKNFEYTFEDFCLLYHEDLEQTMTRYGELIGDLALGQQKNNFAQGLVKSTGKKSKRGKK
ncbi:hypothetical protein [Bacillus suaedae]|uniref:Uncharacterized protein n=1 Tax=Halalkalibacter suaedae TaxID=2822140 RepID=A0A940WRE9_9BACI|nr:hypothetical protein [Bacillus suaedae]MBP3951125.1 hypothetical protein [Bacillus suaedae]